MTDSDVAGAVHAFMRGFQSTGARAGAPDGTGDVGSAAEERWRRARARHFLASDRGGSWVAVDDDGDNGEAVVGMAQAIVREGMWVLSQLVTVPECQGHGIGGELLRLALTYGDPDGPGTIQCSRDPRAMALYSAHGFALHPATAGVGLVRRPGTRPTPVERFERDHVGRRELDIVASVDRAVRGAARTSDLVAMLEQPGSRLLVHDERGYAVALADRVITLGARDDESASLVLRTMLSESPPGKPVVVNWLTSEQQWAVAVLVGAGVELQPCGPVMVRGADGPPRPYIPSEAFG
jgi:GNAT superfamily N-acetyltransferase